MSASKPSAGDPSGSVDFIRERILADNEAGTYGGRVQTRFPPEPNGYLHIGHAKAICLNFALAEEFGGTIRLRMDDTNPLTEDTDFVTGIEEDIAWLGYEPDGPTLYASDYFEQLYAWAESLIERGLAYVDDQDAEAISAGRGGFGQEGTDSPWRDRSPEENLGLFRQMRDGVFDEGEKVLRAKIDMNDPNMWLRDPVLYRIRKVPHHRTEDRWCIYPTYDWAHGQSDAIEGVTHSLCTLEFDVHRPLYDWCLDQLELPSDRPQQIEFARLNITHTITSKRKLAQLVEQGHVDGWDDPRMPTLRGLRRRGYPPAAIREFMDHIGVARVDGTLEIELLESFVRTELNRTALRRMAVLDPVKVIITNWPEGQTDWLDAIENPEDPDAGTRQIPFTGELWIEHDDFKVEPPPKYYRLTPGREVRLRAGYFITAHDYVLDDDKVVEVHCTYDPETRGGQAPDGRKVKSTIHWVSAAHALDARVALYDRLFTDPHPAGHDDVDPLDFVNAASRELRTNAKLEPVLEYTPLGEVVQFERLGYFAHDRDQPLLFHRTVGLRDEWARIQKRKQSGG